MGDLQGQRIVPAEAIPAIAVSDAINHIVGSTATLLERPDGSTILTMIAEDGDFRFRLGDQVSDGMPDSVDVSSGVDDGTGSIRLLEGEKIVLPAPKKITVKGYTGTDVLTYYWL